MMRTARTNALRLMTALVLYLAGSSVIQMSQPFFERGWAVRAFYDFRLWRTALETYSTTEELYDTETPGYYLPGSHSLYKYPPTFAALLKPFVGTPQQQVGRWFLYGNFMLLVATYALLWTSVPIRRSVGVCTAAVFAAWRPTWETISDLQMETIILFFLAGAVWLFVNGRPFAAGVGMGVAGAFKVYPWLELLGYIRRPRVVLGGIAGALATLLVVASVFPLRYSFQFFFEILPRLGGTSLSYENVSLPANLGRVALAIMRGLPSAEGLDPMYLEQPGLEPVRATATVLSVVFLLALAFGAWRCRRVWAQQSAQTRNTLTLAIGTCAVVTLIPTAWMSYQMLLVLPLYIVFAALRRSTFDWIGWSIAVSAALIGTTLYSYGPWFERSPAWFSVIRSCLPLLIVLAGWRARRGLLALASKE